MCEAQKWAKAMSKSKVKLRFYSAKIEIQKTQAGAFGFERSFITQRGGLLNSSLGHTSFVERIIKF